MFFYILFSQSNAFSPVTRSLLFGPFSNIFVDIFANPLLLLGELIFAVGFNTCSIIITSVTPESLEGLGPGYQRDMISANLWKTLRASVRSEMSVN